MFNKLEVSIENYRIIIGEQYLNLDLSLHEGLMLVAEILFMQDNEKRMRQVCEGFYANLFNSLSLLPDKQLQALIHTMELPTLACVARMFRSYKFTEKIIGFVSQRKLEALEEEPIYFQQNLLGLKEYKAYMAPFVDRVFSMVINKELELPDPKSLYF